MNFLGVTIDEKPETGHVYRVRYAHYGRGWKVCSLNRLKQIMRAHPNAKLKIQRSAVEWQEVSRDAI